MPRVPRTTAFHLPARTTGRNRTPQSRRPGAGSAPHRFPRSTASPVPEPLPEPQVGRAPTPRRTGTGQSIDRSGTPPTPSRAWSCLRHRVRCRVDLFQGERSGPNGPPVLHPGHPPPGQNHPPRPNPPPVCMIREAIRAPAGPGTEFAARTKPSRLNLGLFPVSFPHNTSDLTS